jgi:hypothetical protein
MPPRAPGVGLEALDRASDRPVVVPAEDRPGARALRGRHRPRPPAAQVTVDFGDYPARRIELGITERVCGWYGSRPLK